MKARELLKGLQYSVICGDEDVEIKEIYNDSRKVGEQGLFFCIVGANFDGHAYVKNVIDKGAVCLVVQKDVEPVPGVLIVKVDSTRYAMGIVSSNFYGNPSSKLTVIGITGTKGKTTTTYMIREMLMSAGHKTGLIGTIEIIDGNNVTAANNTTPESMIVHKKLKDMVDNGLDSVVMEVSSQALKLHRVSGFTFDIGVFTNLEPDHIGENEHKDFEEYMHCKSLLFRQCRLGIFNGDDEHLEGIMKGHTCEVETFGYKSINNLVAENVELKKEHGALGVKYHVSGLLDFDVEVNVPGKFSVYITHSYSDLSSF